jgi:hypothetical protein
MYTAIIIFVFFAILVNTLAIISLTLCKQSQPKIVPDYAAADCYIDTLDKRFNWSVYRDYLALHFAKYPNGILPKLSMTLTAKSYDVDYSLSFYDCLNENTVKYLKQAMKLLKEPKPKRAKQSRVLDHSMATIS